jgi:uncharacterized membrane protein
MGIVIVGMLARFVGLFIAIPVVSIALAFVYRALYRQTFESSVPPAAAQVSSDQSQAPPVSS